MPKDFLSLENVAPGELLSLLEEAIRMKNDPPKDQPLKGKTIGMIFYKNSTRTRIGFEIGMHQLGGYAMMLRPDDIQLTRGESLTDTARIMSRYMDGLVVRTFKQQELVELAEEASIPIINALTDKFHPCQSVADYMTLLDKKGSLKGLKLAYIGDGNNVANSLILGGALLGVNLTAAIPEGYAPDPEVVSRSESFLSESGGSLSITNDPKGAAEDADAIYTDVWASMGHESEVEKRRIDFAGYTVDDELLKLAKKDCCVMHCLPAHRGEEISASVIDGPQSVVLDQAENKLHAQKAILKMALGD